jgi:hypothetical protein
MSDIYRVAASGGTPQTVSADRYTSEFFAAPAPDGIGLRVFGARLCQRAMVAQRQKSH